MKNIEELHDKIKSVESIFIKGYASMQVTRNRILIIKDYTNYSDCIYVTLLKDLSIIVLKERVFSNKHKYKNIDTLIFSKNVLSNDKSVLEYIENIV